MRRVFPYLAQKLYAVYLEGTPRSRLYGIYMTKKEALRAKQSFLRNWEASLWGGRKVRAVVVPYDKS
jgi:hypothetical protein